PLSPTLNTTQARRGKTFKLITPPRKQMNNTSMKSQCFLLVWSKKLTFAQAISYTMNPERQEPLPCDVYI
ncbi:hypothetical protein ACJJWY_004540, partial [Salmonella enterica subsp. enterica serovar Montevideo]